MPPKKKAAPTPRGSSVKRQQFRLNAGDLAAIERIKAFLGPDTSASTAIHFGLAAALREIERLASLSRQSPRPEG